MRQLLQIVTIIRNLGILQNETIHRMNPYSMNPQKVLSEVTTEFFDFLFFIYIYISNKLNPVLKLVSQRNVQLFQPSQ